VSAGITAIYRDVLRGTYRRDLNVERHREHTTEWPSSASHNFYASFAFLSSWIFVISTGLLFAKWCSY